MSKWKELFEILQLFYRDQGAEGRVHGDSKYLKEAFEKTESLWLQQIARIDTIKMIMLSEAPLFGKEENYFYNPKTKNTAFFHANDIQALDSNLIPPKNLQQEERKQQLIDSLTGLGFVVLDIFPFAFNESNTAITYNRLSKKSYAKLLESTYQHYLSDKLDLIKKKSAGRLGFVYRYKRLKDRNEQFIAQQITKKQIPVTKKEIASIHGSNMSLSRTRLAEEWRQLSEIS